MSWLHRLKQRLNVDLADITPFGWFLVLTAFLVACFIGYGIDLACSDFLGRSTKPIPLVVGVGAGLGWFWAGHVLGSRFRSPGIRVHPEGRPPSFPLFSLIFLGRLDKVMAEGLRDAAREEDEAESLGQVAAWTTLPGCILGALAGFLFVLWACGSHEPSLVLAVAGVAAGGGIGMAMALGLVYWVKTNFGRRAAVRVAWGSYALLVALYVAKCWLEARFGQGN
jgi:hypothetical protein